MTENSKTHIDTSGWHYGHWEGIFYTKDIDLRRSFGAGFIPASTKVAAKYRTASKDLLRNTRPACKKYLKMFD